MSLITHHTPSLYLTPFLPISLSIYLTFSLSLFLSPSQYIHSLFPFLSISSQNASHSLNLSLSQSGFSSLYIIIIRPTESFNCLLMATGNQYSFYFSKHEKINPIMSCVFRALELFLFFACCKFFFTLSSVLGFYFMCVVFLLSSTC